MSKTTNETIMSSDDDIIPLEENTNYDLVCSITNTNPAPLLQLMGEAQIHYTLTSTVNLTMYKRTFQEGLVVPSTSVVRTLTDIWIDVFGGVKQFSCNASINPFYAAAVLKIQPQTAITRCFAKFYECKQLSHVADQWTTLTWLPAADPAQAATVIDNWRW